ncbi:MAG: 4-hydroxythreonine-4-phosphate dehydrogenase PdxA [Pseudomonadota bacterium]
MTSAAKKPLVLTLGDPAGCGPSITAKAWQALQDQPDMAFCLIGSEDIAAAHGPTKQVTRLDEVSAAFGSGLPVLDIGPSAKQPTAGEPDTIFAPLILNSIEEAVSLVRNGTAGGVVTNPINKALLYNAGFAHPGHTEFLARLCTEDGQQPPRPVMMLVGGGLRVALATIHLPLAEAAKSLSIDLLTDIARITHKALQQDFGLNKPRIAFSGLNPHAGEEGAIGRDEIDVINPAARILRHEGIDISDARSADTLFAETLGGAFDAVIAMTHDQALIPVKTLDFWGGVNVTLGLPVIRTSPDHGTAYEAAAAGTCRADSLIAAIRLAAENANRRANG